MILLLIGNEVDNKSGSFFSVFTFLAEAMLLDVVVGCCVLLFIIGFMVEDGVEAADKGGLVIVALLRSLLKFGVALMLLGTVGGGVDEKTVGVWC